MFDDPRRELNRLQRELLAEEEYEEDYETEYEDDDLADILAILHRDEEAAPQEEPPYRNYANNYGRREPSPPQWDDWEEDDRMVYSDEEDEDHRVLYRDDPRTVRRTRREKGIRGLVILACLELLGILLILGWWMLWLI